MTDRTRFSGLFNAQGHAVTLIGAGGIGSLLAITLAKMGFDLLIVDDDVVSSVNTGTQLYGDDQIGALKVYALLDPLQRYAPDVRVDIVHDRVNADDDRTARMWYQGLANEIIISGVDSIASRKAIWDVLTYNLHRPAFRWYIDLRMGLLDLYAYVANSSPESLAFYENVLNNQDDSLIADLPCTSKATWFSSCGASMLAGTILMKILQGQAPKKIYTLNLDTWMTAAV